MSRPYTFFGGNMSEKETIDREYQINRKYVYAKMRKPIKVGENVYPSISCAALKLGCSPSLITSRLKSGKLLNGLKVEKGESK